MRSARHNVVCLAASRGWGPSSGVLSSAEAADRSLRRDYLKSAEEIMEILEAYDLTGSFRDAAELAGCSHHTVAAHVAARDAGRVCGVAVVRPQLIDEYLDKVEEWVEQSVGKIRADKAHDKLLALGYAGSERTTRRAVAMVKKDHRAGRRRVHRPWVTEPGMWLLCSFLHNNHYVDRSIMPILSSRSGKSAGQRWCDAAPISA